MDSCVSEIVAVRMSSPWAKIEKPDPVNFLDIVSEQVAADLAKKERIHVDSFAETNVGLSEACAAFVDEEVDLATDEEIARALQANFDKEYDEEVKRNQNKFNGASKVAISFEKYMNSSSALAYDIDSEEEEAEDPSEKKNWDRFEAMDKEYGTMPTCGYKIKDGNIITKHDMEMNAKKNACKLLSFPPEFHTGDGLDLTLPAKPFNSLKIFSQNEQTRRRKVRDKKEDEATVMSSLDRYTTLIVHKMLNNKIIESFNGNISTGKEAAVFHAYGCVDCDKLHVPSEVAVKVFKTTLSDFRQRDIYIRDDHRFKGQIGKQNSKKFVHSWAEKEMANLYRLKRANIPCPEVVLQRKHVLVMSFIGENRVPARKLKDAQLDAADYHVAYDQVVNMMRSLFQDALLIHADLSEYNILWHDNQCYFIDLAQSVEPYHENAFKFLFRDCRNVTNFFERKLKMEIASPETLFEFVTGCNYEDKKLLAKLQSTIKLKPHMMDDNRQRENFEELWNNLPNRIETIKA